MGTIEYLAIAVTIVGAILCFLFMAFLFFGSRIPGDNGKTQIIKFKGVELQTSSVVTVLLISAVITVLPFIIMQKEESKTTHGGDPESIRMYLRGRVEDVDGKAVKGAVAIVSEESLKGESIPLGSQTIDSSGDYSFTIAVRKDSTVKLETRKEKYKKQIVTIQLKEISFNPVLVKEEQ